MVFDRALVEVRVLALPPRFVDHVEATMIQKYTPVGNTRMEWVHTRDYEAPPF